MRTKGLAGSFGWTNVTTRAHDPLPFPGAKTAAESFAARNLMAGALHGFESRGSYSLVVVVAASQGSSAVSGRLGYAAFRRRQRISRHSAARSSNPLHLLLHDSLPHGRAPGRPVTDGGHPGSRFSPAPRLTLIRAAGSPTSAPRQRGWQRAVSRWSVPRRSVPSALGQAPSSFTYNYISPCYIIPSSFIPLTYLLPSSHLHNSGDRLAGGAKVQRRCRRA